MWCCVSIPLVFLGAYFGYKSESITYPTVTSTIARAIPDPGLLLHPYVAIALAGMVPFAAAYVELFFIMTSLLMYSGQSFRSRPPSKSPLACRCHSINARCAFMGAFF